MSGVAGNSANALSIGCMLPTAEWLSSMAKKESRLEFRYMKVFKIKRASQSDYKIHVASYNIHKIF